MTIVAEPLPLTVNGEDVQPSDMSMFLRITQGLEDMPLVRGKDLVIPSREGRIAYPRVGDSRRIVLTGWVQGIVSMEGPGDKLADQRDQYRTKADYVKALFNPRETVTIVALLELATPQTATISARPMNALWGREIPSEYSSLSIELESVDPDWLIDEVP